MLETKKFITILDKKDRSRLIIVSFLMIIAVLSELLSLSLIYPLLNIITKDNYLESSFFFYKLMDYLNLNTSEFKFFLCIIFFSTFFFKLLFLIFYYWRINKFAFALEAKISRKLFTTYISRSYYAFIDTNSTAYMQNIIKETTTLTFGFILPLMRFFTEVFVVIFIIILLMILELKASLLIFFVFISFLIFYFLFIKKFFLKWGKKRLDAENNRILILKDIFESIKDIKIYFKEHFFFQKFNNFNNQKSKYHSYAETLNSLPVLLFEFLIITILIFFIFFLLSYDKKIETYIPVFGLFGAAAFRLIPSFNRILSSMQNIRFAKPVLNEISSVLSDKNKKDYFDINLSTSNKIDFESLEIDNLSFSHENNINKVALLNDIKFHFKQNETIGIVGESGSGKTTLVNLLLGLLIPHTGTIKFNGVDIHNDIQNWRSLIGYVSQNIYLLDDTLIKNIAFGIENENINRALVTQALKLANLSSLIEKLDKGVNTSVGEKGNKFSGGQIQRIGLARALYRNPKILILDEATSALDLNNEDIIMDEINSNLKKCAKIIVSHRLNTLKHCNRIYNIEKNNLKLI